MICSVIIPVYNERENVRTIHEELGAAATAEPSLSWEFLFVDDGSTDETFGILREVNRTDPRVKVVRLSRNYGSHTGAAAGLQFASGDVAVIMAGDMQDHPREIPRFLSKWRDGFDVVLGVHASRQDSLPDRILSAASAMIIRRIALPQYPPRGIGSLCLLDRKVIDALNAFPERNRLTAGLILFAGFRQTEIEYHRLARYSGTSKWSIRRKIKLMIDTLVSFSSLPLRLTSAAGLAIAALSISYAVYLAIGTLFYGHSVEGWTTTIVIMLMLGGVQLCVMGILGEYLWRVCDEVRCRPLFLVQELVGIIPERAPSPRGIDRRATPSPLLTNRGAHPSPLHQEPE